MFRLITRRLRPKRYFLLTLTTTVGLSSGCIHYQPRPLEAPGIYDRLTERTLNNPELARLAQSSGVVASWPPASWDVGALTVVALLYSPDLEVARASWALARTGVATAAERLNPGVSAGPGYNASTAPATVTPWILNLNLDFTIETHGKRKLRTEEARHRAEAARYLVADKAWQARARIRQALLDLFSAQEIAVALDRQRLLQENNVMLFQRQLDAGEISRFQMSQARLLLYTLRLSLLDAQRQQNEARASLAAAIGLPVSSIEAAPVALDNFRRLPTDLPEASIRRQALTNRADLLSALWDYEASQASLQLAIARQYPDIHLGPGYQLDQGSHKWTLLFGLNLPVFNRNRGPIAEAEARRTLAASQVDSVQARSIAELDKALVSYRAALAKISAVQATIDELQQAEQLAQRQLAAGEISQLDLGVVQVELAGRELARIEAVTQAQQALGDIEDAMQMPTDLPLDPLPRPPQ